MTEIDKQRRSIRLPGYDYSQFGAYFITICCANRQSFFGNVTDSGLKHRPMGEFAQEMLVEMCSASHHIALDYYVVMPNHVHAIIWVNPNEGVESKRAKHGFAPTSNRAAYGTQPHSLQSFAQAYKSSVQD